MTREEALIQLRLGPGINEDVSEEYNEAVNMAIEALKQQPNDNEQIIRISKGTLKARTGRYVIYDVEWLKENFNTTEVKIYGQPKAEGARGDIPLQQSVPKIPQPKTGHWTHDGGCWENRWICSECGYKLYAEQSKYCPECGAKMQEAK